MRRVRLAVAAAISAPAIAGAAEAPARKEFSADAIRLVEIRTERGDIDITGAGSWNVVAVPTGDASAARCVIVMARHGSNVVLEARSVDQSRGKAAKCHAGFKVEVPLDLPVYAFSGSGNVAVGPREGDSQIETGSGAVRFQGSGGKISVRSGSGGLEGTLAARDLELLSGAGNVALRWSEAPAKGKAVIRTGSGDVALTFPPDAVLRDDVTTGSGEYRNEFGASGPDSFQLTIVSGAGNVALRKAKQTVRK